MCSLLINEKQSIVNIILFTYFGIYLFMPLLHFMNLTGKVSLRCDCAVYCSDTHTGGRRPAASESPCRVLKSEQP